MTDARAWIVPPLLALAATLGFLGLAAAGSPASVTASLVISPAILALAAGSAAVAAARADGALRRGWALLGASFACTMTADAIWAWYAWGDVAPPVPSLADVFYLVAFAPLIGGLLALPAARVTPGERARLVLDVATVFLGAVIVVGEAIAAVATFDADAGTLVATLGPPVGDLAVVGAIASLLLRAPAPSLRVPLLWLLAGIGVGLVADFAYAVWELEGTYGAASPIDAAWMLGNTLTVAAAWWPRQRADGGAGARAAWAGLAEALPYLGMALGFAVLVRLAATGGEPRVPLAVEAGLLCVVVATRQALLWRENQRLGAEVARQLARSEELLLNVLPGSVAQRLKERPAEPIADGVDDATVLFADLVGFTPLAAKTPADELLAILNDVFRRFDALADAYGLEKIKTIGDAYMAVCGVPAAHADHADRALAMAVAMLDALDAVNRERGLALQLRVGLHSGPLVAGVIGRRKFAWDLWGDTVNTASRMESHGVPGQVHLSVETRRRLVGAHDLVGRGVVEVKGKGPVETWLTKRTGS